MSVKRRINALYRLGVLLGPVSRRSKIFAAVMVLSGLVMSLSLLTYAQLAHAAPIQYSQALSLIVTTRHSPM